MKRNNKFILFIVILTASIAAGYLLFGRAHHLIPTQNNQPTSKANTSSSLIRSVAHIHLHRDSYKNLPGWLSANDHTQSLTTFQASCQTILHQDPNQDAGSQLLKLKIKDWQPACRAAMKLDKTKVTDEKAKLFFEHWFSPLKMVHETPEKKRPLKGLFTGYYMPLLHGSLVKTTDYNVPIYARPDNLITVDLEKFDAKWRHKKLVGRVHENQLIPFYTRAEIDQGALNNHAEIIAWTKSVVDRLNLEIEGSGIVELPNGEQLYLGYASGNGAAYTPIARILIKRGVFTRDTASMQAIRHYFKSHPSQVKPVINHNKSFVFFRLLDKKVALGAQGVGLTSGYSLAVDRQWIPLGTPLWLSTTHPDPIHSTKHHLQRLMIAQDTGGAIRGAVRGDVYWGSGKHAAGIAGKMRNQGKYWILVPKHVAAFKEAGGHKKL